jgi:sulfur carrier protein ThiS
MSQTHEPNAPENGNLFLLFRRKVQASDVLSAATVKLIHNLGFTGRLTVVLQNGQILKSGYEEGYFRRKDDWNL